MIESLASHLNVADIFILFFGPLTFLIPVFLIILYGTIKNVKQTKLLLVEAKRMDSFARQPKPRLVRK